MMKVVFPVRRTKFVYEEMGGIKSMVTQHIQQRPHGNCRTKKVRTLCKCYPRQKTRIRASANCDFPANRATMRDKPFRGRNKIVECVLTVVALPGTMPLFAKLPSSAQVRESKETALFNQKGGINIELRRTTDAESAVSTQKSWQRTTR